MSFGIHPVLNPPVPEAQCDGLGEALAAEFAMLDILADEHGLTRLIADTPAVALRLQAPNDIVAELHAIADTLAIGEKSGSQFRLEMA